MRALAILLCIAALLLAASAGAQSTSSQTDSRSLSQRAKAAFDAGDFATAAKLLEQAYKLKPWPTYLYNLGRTYQQAGNKEQAIDAYERYLVLDPRSSDAGAVRESIRQLKDQIARDRALEDQTEAAKDRAAREGEEAKRALEAADRARLEANEAAERSKHKASAWPWVVAGVGLGAVAAGAVLGGLSSSAHAAAVSDASVDQALADQSSAHTFALVANILFIAGATTSVVGAVWGVFDLRIALTKSVRAGALPGGFVVGGTF